MADFDNGRFGGGYFDGGRFGDNRSWGSVDQSPNGYANSYAETTTAQRSQLAEALADRMRAAVGPTYGSMPTSAWGVYGALPSYSAAINPTTKVKDLPRDIVADVLTAPPNTAINMAPPTMAPPTTVTSYAPTAAPSAAAAAIGGQMATGHPGVSYNGPAAPTSGPNAGGNFGLTDLPSLNSMMSPKANIGGILSNMAGPIGGLLGALGMERAGTPAGGYGGILGGLLGRTNSGDGLGGGGPGGRNGGGTSGGRSGGNSSAGDGGRERGRRG